MKVRKNNNKKECIEEEKEKWQVLLDPIMFLFKVSLKQIEDLSPSKIRLVFCTKKKEMKTFVSMVNWIDAITIIMDRRNTCLNYVTLHT